jgi:AcrR family transcriptional regulator
MYKKSEQLRGDLLDAAEHLFAQKGYEGTSIRDVTDYLGVRLAAVNYHFDNKQNLLLEVVRRRAAPLRQARLECMDQVNIDPKKPRQTVLSLLKAFVQPMLDFYLSGDKGWRSYCIYIAQLTVNGGEHAALVSKEYDEAAAIFIEKLGQALPKMSDFHLHSCFQFIIGSFIFIVCDNKRLDRLSQDRYHSSDVGALTEPYYEFVTNGVLGLAGLVKVKSS